MADSALVSIVMPSFNQGTFIEKAILSVLEQGCGQVELIVMDGGSTDGSRAIIERYAGRLAYWQSQPDDGQSAAINAGFHRSKGGILGWLNSDDELLPGALEIVGEFFREHPEARFVFGDCELVDEEGRSMKVLREPYWCEAWQRYVRSCVGQPSAFWRRDLWGEVGGVDSSLRYAMDYDLWFKMARVTKMHHLPRVLSRQRQHRDTKTHASGGGMEAEMKLVRERCFGPSSRLGHCLKKIFYRLHRVCAKAARGCYRTGGKRTDV